jgi:4-hydroxy-tetrahydrodipicolinate synthase
LDIGGLETLVEHVLAGGVHGIFLLGTTGEGPALSRRLQCDLVQRVCRQAAGRIPVLVGVTDTSFVESVNLIRVAETAGAEAVVYAGPCYFPVSPGELAEHVERLSGGCPLPLFLYNMPSHTHVTFDVDVVRRLAALPAIAGLKDSSGCMLYFQQLCRQFADRPDFSLLMGPEELLVDAVLVGAHGGVCGGANLFPRLYVRLYEAAASGAIEEAIRLRKTVWQVSAGVYRAAPDASGYLRGLKCALSLLGICDDFMAEPYTRFGEIERNAITAALSQLDAIEGVKNLRAACSR